MRNSPAKLTVDFSNARLLPVHSVTVHLEIRNRYTGERSRQNYIFRNLESSKSELPLHTELCGELECTVLRFECRDSLGIFSIRRRGNSVCSCTVMPQASESDENVNFEAETNGLCLTYTPEEYAAHLAAVQALVRNEKNYHLTLLPNAPFQDLQIFTMKNAAWNNGYNPTEPYTLEMCRSANAPQETTFTGYGMVYYLYILAPGGWDSFQRSVEIWQPMGSDMYKVFNCPALYTQCKNIYGTWNGLK